MQRKPHVHIERKPPLRPLYVVEKRSGALGVLQFVLGFLVARSGLYIVVVFMFYPRDIYCIMLYCFSLSYSFCLLYKAIQSSDCNDVK